MQAGSGKTERPATIAGMPATLPSPDITPGFFVLVEDVVSSGGALVDAINKLRSDGLLPSAALCVIDRETGGAEALAAAGLPLRALFTFAQVEGAPGAGLAAG